ncbi:hypothetical protein C0995_001062, partial [Termitomyces sp. Mi166
TTVPSSTSEPAATTVSNVDNERLTSDCDSTPGPSSSRLDVNGEAAAAPMVEAKSQRDTETPVQESSGLTSSPRLNPGPITRTASQRDSWARNLMTQRAQDATVSEGSYQSIPEAVRTGE